jgi:cobalt/nickel transport system permease protein
LVSGAALAAGGVAVGLRKMDYDRIPQVAVLSSAFFVATLVHVPLGGTSVHLVLNGLVGLVLGWAAFPAILAALFLQAVLFQHGGLTTLGVNTLTMALPALACYYLFRSAVVGSSGRRAAACGFLAGALAILFAATLVGAALILTGRSLTEIAELVFLAHIPVAAIEGLITGAVVGYLRQVRPELLRAPIVEGK